jgi:hypothetical protein
MALRLSNNLKSMILSQMVDAIAGTVGTAGTASIIFYTGSQPASADSAASGTALCTIPNIGWGDDTYATITGTSSLCGTYTGTAGVTGTCGWARITTVGLDYQGTAATFTIDADVGTASTHTIVVNSVSMSSAGVVSLYTAPIILS